jgi:hypothetical protein
MNWSTLAVCISAVYSRLLGLLLEPSKRVPAHGAVFGKDCHAVGGEEMMYWA